jgi:hypothetical protein
VQGLQVQSSHKPPLPSWHNKIGGQHALYGLWMKQGAKMTWDCSVRVCLRVLLSINLLFRCVVLCTHQRVDVDALMGLAEVSSNSFVHSLAAPPVSLTQQQSSTTTGALHAVRGTTSTMPTTCGACRCG